jgi:hypothetical protein
MPPIRIARDLDCLLAGHSTLRAPGGGHGLPESTKEAPRQTVTVFAFITPDQLISSALIPR